MAPRIHSGCSPVAAKCEPQVNISFKSQQWKVITVKPAKPCCGTQLSAKHTAQCVFLRCPYVTYNCRQLKCRNRVKQMSNVFYWQHLLRKTTDLHKWLTELMLLFDHTAGSQRFNQQCQVSVSRSIYLLKTKVRQKSLRCNQNIDSNSADKVRASA